MIFVWPKTGPTNQKIKQKKNAETPDSKLREAEPRARRGRQGGKPPEG